MKLKRCDQMHYYDAEINEKCPYCSGSTGYSPGIGDHMLVTSVDKVADMQVDSSLDEEQTELISRRIISKG